jgi:2-dehydropantoate 2-reductase
MKILVVGAGAIGGYLGVKLARAGQAVTFVARGESLAAIHAGGMKLITPQGIEEHATGVSAVETAEDAGPQDVVLLAVKAHQVAAVAPAVQRLLRADTTVVTLQNGIPWWYFHRHGGPHEGRVVRAADPDGSIARFIDPERVIGCVVYPAAILVAPGVVRVVEGERFSLGELDGSTTPRIEALASALTGAGLKAPVVKDLRSEIWLKLWGNLSFNPLSALTHATLAAICRFPATRDLSAKMMAEATAIAEKLGVTMRISIERRIAGAEKVGEHKTSMLQDVEHGRPLELDALLGPIVELADLTATPIPNISAVYAISSLLARTLESAHGRLAITPR